MRPYSTITPMIAVCAMLISMSIQPARAGTPLPDAPHVVANGEGRVSAKPDSAQVSLSVSARDADAAVVKRRVDDAVNGFLAALKQRSISTDDVSASALAINEDVEYEDGKRISRGFRGQRSVQVRIRDIASINAIINEGLAAGMNGVDSVSFKSLREDALRQQAREAAATQSRERASALAAAYGARLGRVYSINSVNSNIMNRYGASLDRVVVTGSRAPAPAAPGQYIEPSIEFNEGVDVVFEIIP